MERPPLRVVTGLVFLLGLILLAVRVFTHPIGGGGALNVLALIGLALGMLAAVGYALTGVTRCPACRTEMDEIVEGTTATCESCGVTLMGDAKRVWTVDERYVHDTPVFPVTLPERFAWPPACCVCGAQPTRMIQASLKKGHTGRNVALAVATGGMLIRTGGGSTVQVEVPHCDDCSGGADLHKPALEDLQIRFRSRGYALAFERLQEARAGAGPPA
ncbi:MAG: hypothetical protein D6701_06460 [Gemmatimonadetes bacterium]|nr:MAG: hypothetical protein D6701_06460 [Gemmatimonadota bacterium]